MGLSEDHQRYTVQARWTESLRAYLLNRAGIPENARVLEVGCGTGAVANTLDAYTKRPIFGLDIAFDSVRFAQKSGPFNRFTCGNALRLPFAAGAFDVVCCHFLLLWVKDAQAAVTEMARACRRGGAVIAFAEPDYGGRVDYPQEMEEAGRLQALALARRGADPNMGRRLAGLFNAAGMTEVETGVMAGQWSGQIAQDEWESEWQTLERDLTGLAPKSQRAAWREADRRAWAEGSRVLFVPTFYALGRKK